MKKCFKTIALAMCVVFLAGFAWAASIDNHVKVAPNGKGDVLIFPFYAAIDGGWETKLTVVNTSEAYSTVAKVIVRSPVFSEEILDFFIYLSPTDVWTGTVKFDAVDGAIMESDDDSIVTRVDGTGNPVWGDVEPARRALVIPRGAGDFNEMGYIYVVNIATWDEGPPPVDKDDIYDTYRAIESIENYPPQNILAGWMDFQVAGFGLTSALNALTLRDYKNITIATIATETKLGEDALNTRIEVEAALSKDNIAMPYLNNEDISLHFLTFPTKYSEIAGDGTIGGVESPFTGFRRDLNYCVRYQLSIFDTTEDSLTPADPVWSPRPPQEFSDLCKELNWVVSDDAPFEEGWILYNFGYATIGENFNEEEMTYTGAPVIPVSLNIGASGMSLKYGAWTDGEVSSTAWYDGEVIDFYQYADFGVNALNNNE